jgi:hypothetical protein
MAWETTDGRRYYYRSVRRGDKVQKVYLGTGIFGEFAARWDEEKRERQAAKREREQTELDRLEALGAPVLELDEVVDVLALEERRCCFTLLVRKSGG